jgi:hypothetical protein
MFGISTHHACSIGRVQQGIHTMQMVQTIHWAMHVALHNQSLAAWGYGQLYMQTASCSRSYCSVKSLGRLCTDSAGITKLTVCF